MRFGHFRRLKFLMLPLITTVPSFPLSVPKGFRKSPFRDLDGFTIRNGIFWLFHPVIFSVIAAEQFISCGICLDMTGYLRWIRSCRQKKFLRVYGRSDA